MKQRVCIFLVLLATAVGTVFAVPAVPWLIDKQLADGSTISYYLKGDEKINWMESPGGYTLLCNDEQEIVYAQHNEQGDLVPSTVKYTASGLRSSEAGQFQKGLRYSPSQRAAFLQTWKLDDGATTSKSSLRAGLGLGEVKGTKKVICVMMDFPDRRFTKSAIEFDALMNQTGYSAGTAQGSVKDFYKENSYEQMDMEVTVLGPYTTSQNASYYATSRAFTLAQAAVEKLSADPNVNLSDFAVDGKVESFHIIFAGWGAETGLSKNDYIWSYAASWPDGRAFASADGVSFYRASHSPELRGSSGSMTTGIGVICHETCHVFGAPDYYDTDEETGGQFQGSGNWDLMSGGNWNGAGDVPAHINMLQKILFGWVTPTELTSYQEISDMSASANNPQAYTYTANANGERYLLENRQQVGFDSYVPGHGLLIWHVHQKALGGNANNRTTPQQLYPVVASSVLALPGNTPTSYGSINSAGTPFPGSSGKTSFTDWSVPQAFTWQGMQGIGQPITNITEYGRNKISFTFMDPAEKDPYKTLELTAVGNDVRVQWQTPKPYLPSTLFYADQVASAWSIVVNERTYAVRFTPDDLEIYPGYQLTAISYGVLNSNINLVVAGSPTLKYTLCVWTGGNGTAPQILVHEQDVPDLASNFNAGWHKIALDSPITIDSSKDLWFGIRVTKKNPFLVLDGPIYPFACDAGPKVLGKGIWTFEGGVWDNNATRDYNNWALNASIEPTESVQSYLIKRNGGDLTSVLAGTTTYLDPNVPAGDYEYSLIANYLTFSAEPIYGGISIDPTDITVVVSDEEMIRTVTVYNLQGGLVYRNNAVNANWSTVRHTLPDYPCIVQVVTQSGVVKTTKHLR
ncbi:MAG: M6 family metalloprotease domain-containing protein [Candidatus Symbiothrix sp.]|jgi:M6 family metalloprotease-like protein|nr:M6 family metalloprotease domain-containing protein [Candidatus Symbiothrix sp.]